jgi:exodeoxyribonuclease VIII|tara:strand:- start:2038 stop:2808 length:771 start_codon:yes stop_codon:yes gene_type:complete
MKFEVGVYDDIPYEVYQDIEAYRSHDLTTVIRCPYTWKNQVFNNSPALLEGRVQHTVFLEHDKFDDEFVIEPSIDKRTKVGKAEYQEFLETVGDRTPIKQDLYNICMERREVVSEYLPKETDRVERTCLFYWYDHPFKCRMDLYDGENIWDLKTARDASPRGFKRAVNNFNYYMQAALYLDGARAAGLPADKFYFLAQEKLAPFPYAVYVLSDEAAEYGRARNEQAFKTLLKCKDSGDYKPFNVDGVQEITVDDLY